MHLAAVAAGVLLAAVVVWDAFQTVILSSPSRAAAAPDARLLPPPLVAALRAATQGLPPSRAEGEVLTVFGPLSVLLLIASWAFGLVLAFASLLGDRGADAGAGRRLGFGTDLHASGTTFFTLGHR